MKFEIIAKAIENELTVHELLGPYEGNEAAYADFARTISRELHSDCHVFIEHDYSYSQKSEYVTFYVMYKSRRAHGMCIGNCYDRVEFVLWAARKDSVEVMFEEVR